MALFSIFFGLFCVELATQVSELCCKHDDWLTLLFLVKVFLGDDTCLDGNLSRSLEMVSTYHSYVDVIIVLDGVNDTVHFGSESIFETKNTEQGELDGSVFDCSFKIHFLSGVCELLLPLVGVHLSKSESDCSVRVGCHLINSTEHFPSRIIIEHFVIGVGSNGLAIVQNVFGGTLHIYSYKSRSIGVVNGRCRDLVS